MSSFTGKSWEPGNVSTLPYTPPHPPTPVSHVLSYSLFVPPSSTCSLFLRWEIRGGRMTQQILKRVIERWPGASQAKLLREEADGKETGC